MRKTITRKGGVAGLRRESVDDEVRVDDVALSTVGVRACVRRPAVLSNKRGVDVVQQVAPDFTDV
jgi:hypothetical protein